MDYKSLSHTEPEFSGEVVRVIAHNGDGTSEEIKIPIEVMHALTIGEINSYNYNDEIIKLRDPNELPDPNQIIIENPFPGSAKRYALYKKRLEQEKASWRDGATVEP